MGFPETGIGIYPGLGGTQRLTKRLGLGLARFYIYTGTFIGSGDLSRLNLATEVVPVEGFSDAISRALASARLMASLNPSTGTTSVARLSRLRSPEPMNVPV